MSDFDWKQNNDQDKDGINLLPDELRRKEEIELAAMPDKKIEFRQPKKTEGSLPEGKVPWFSFRSWFKRDKQEKKDIPAEAMPDKPQTKFSFRLLKSKKRQESEELERAKEAAIRKHIITEVFEKKGLPLPDNDNDLFNEEQRKKQQESVAKVTDMDIEGSAKVIEPTIDVPLPPVPNIPEKPVISTDLPIVPPLPEIVPPVVLPTAAIEESITPSLPDRPAESSVPPSVTDAPLPEEPHGFHVPTGIFTTQEKKEHSKSTFGVNLIPTSVTVRNWKQLRTILITTTVATLILIAGVFGGLVWWDHEIERQTIEIDAKIQSAEDQILTFQSLKDQIAATEGQIKDIETLLGKHIYWTQFFALLEKYTINDVYFDRFSAGIKGNISLSAHGKDYLAAARELTFLQSPEAKEFVTSATINGVQQSDTGGVNFVIDLQLNNSLFYYAHASSTQQ